MKLLRPLLLASGAALAFVAVHLASASADIRPHVVADDPVAAGRFLVNYGGCNDCHTAGMMEGRALPPESERLLGSRLGFAGPWGVTYPPNLRLVVSSMSPDGWTALIANPGPVGKPPMPWKSLRSLSPGDQLAIYAYLRSLGPGGSSTPADVPPGQAPTTPYLNFTPTMPGAH
ncbi:MAG TPA: hypothetical protein VFB22_17375 [Candidatus Baltobacteraceae bacterium]|nr:hypothetical protein [Candidatus Baltobacteraceae bacterium]